MILSLAKLVWGPVIPKLTRFARGPVVGCCLLSSGMIASETYQFTPFEYTAGLQIFRGHEIDENKPFNRESFAILENSILENIHFLYDREPTAIIHLMRRAHCVHHYDLRIRYPIPTWVKRSLKAETLHPKNPIILSIMYNKFKLTDPENIFTSAIEIRNAPNQ